MTAFPIPRIIGLWTKGRVFCLLLLSISLFVLMPLSHSLADTRRKSGLEPGELVAKYQRDVDNNPTSVEAYLNLCFAYLALDAMQQATETLKYVLRLEADSADAHYWMGRIEYLQGNFEAALSAFQKAIDLRPDWSGGHAESGLCYFRLHKYDEAEKGFTEALRLTSSSKGHRNQFVPPDFFEKADQRWLDKVSPMSRATMTYYLGLLAFERGLFEKAAEYIHQAVRMDPQLAEAHLQLGLIHVQNRSWQKADQAFQEAIRINPQLARAYYQLALVYFKQGKGTEATEAMKRSQALNKAAEHLQEQRAALMRNEQKAPALSNLGGIYLNDHKYEAAVTEYKKALWHDPNLAEARNGLGYAYAMQGKLAEAIREQERALALNPKMAEAYAGLGLARLKQAQLTQNRQDYEAALEMYQQATTLRPNFPEAWLNLGQIYLKLSQPQEAVAAYQKLLSFQPNLPEVHYFLGGLYAKQNQFKRAERAFQRSIELQPEAAAGAYERLAYLYGVQGIHLEQALSLAQKAVALQPKSAVSLNTLSWLYYLNGDYVQATEAIKKALTLEPNNRLYQEGLKAIQRAVQKAKRSKE